MNKEKMGKFVLARHHESEWNKLGKWTGMTEVHLSDDGFKGAKKMGELIQDFHFDYIFTSSQIRAKETLSSMMETMSINQDVLIESSMNLNERDYGIYTGKNKWEMEKILGEEKFTNIRRGWDYPIEGGESLKMVYERSIPFFLTRILPLIKEGKNVLVVCHGNSSRAMIKYIENISDNDIANIEMPFGSVLIYDLDEKGHIIDKEIRQL